MRTHLQNARHRTDHAAGRLNSLNPLAVLERGYTITQRLGDPKPVRDARTLATGTLVYTRYAQGATISRVEPSDAEIPTTDDQP